jgi:uroporphyrinogen-III decarboxylase
MEKLKSGTIRRRFDTIVSGQSVDDAMVVIWNTAPFLNAMFGVKLKDYYMDVEKKLGVQIKFQNEFPDYFCYPGIWADFGALCEPSAFGCEIAWPDDDAMPMAQPAVTCLADIRSMKSVDPKKSGFMAQALDHYRYFWDHLDRKYIDEYGYLDGVATSFGPVELAAVIVGHQNFYLALLEEPELIHLLLKMTTEMVIKWLMAQEEVNGKLKRMAIADHIPGQISLELFEEFWLPYSNQVVETFPDAMILYHNEYPVPYLDALAVFKMDIFHFGGKLLPIKEKLGDKVTLMGNLDPVDLLINGTPEDVCKEAASCLKNGSPGGRFFLSSAGGIAPDTPIENLKAMGQAIIM